MSLCGSVSWGAVSSLLLCTRLVLVGCLAAVAIGASCGDLGGGLTLPLPDGDGSPVDSPPTSGGSNTSGTGTANPDASDPCIQAGLPASPTHREMFNALNSYRASLGLATLSYSKILEKAANSHAMDMYLRDYFDHNSPDGVGPGERAVAAGFCRARSIAENLAWNQQSVAEVQTAWEHSPGHNANMVNPGYRYVGMGYYFSANGPYYVQLFGDVHPN